MRPFTPTRDDTDSVEKVALGADTVSPVTLPPDSVETESVLTEPSAV